MPSATMVLCLYLCALGRDALPYYSFIVATLEYTSIGHKFVLPLCLGTASEEGISKYYLGARKALSY